MLPVRLHKVIGKIQIDAILNIVPAMEFLNRTKPIKFPTERYSGTNIILINVAMFRELLILDFIL